MDLEAAAATLYGQPQAKPAAPTTPATPVTAPAEPASPAADHASMLYGAPQEPAEEQPEAAPVDSVPPQVDVPDTIKQLREADTTRKLYDPQKTYAQAIKADMFSGDENINPAVRDAGVAELREVAADLGLGVTDVAELHNRAGIVKTEGLAPEVAIDRCVDRFNEVFGQDAAQAYRDARALVARDPRVGALLDGWGLSSDAQTAVMLARIARREKMEGRL